MVAIRHKLLAIWRILTSSNIICFTVDPEGIKVTGGGKGDLHDIMLMAIELKRSYNNMVNLADKIAAESGELYALKELKEAIDKIHPSPDDITIKQIR